MSREGVVERSSLLEKFLGEERRGLLDFKRNLDGGSMASLWIPERSFKLQLFGDFPFSSNLAVNKVQVIIRHAVGLQQSRKQSESVKILVGVPKIKSEVGILDAIISLAATKADTVPVLP